MNPQSRLRPDNPLSRILKALLSLWALSILTGTGIQNPVWLAAFGGLLFLYRFVPQASADRRRWPCHLAAALYAATTTASRYVFYTAEFTSGAFRFGYTVIALAGAWLFYDACCLLLTDRAAALRERGVLLEPEDGGTVPDNRLFRIARAVAGWFTEHPFFTCLLFWLPYYLYEYPGILTPDGVNQIEQFLGLDALSNHHPVAHTLTMALFWRIGAIVSDDPNFCLGVITAAQMLFLALCCRVAIRTLAGIRVRPLVRGLVLAFFAVLPYNGVFAVLVLKDVPFTGITLLLLSALLTMVVKPEAPSAGVVLWYALSGVAFCIFRSNGWFAFLLMTPFLLLLCRQRTALFIRLLISGVCVILAAALWRGPVLNAMGARRPDLAESLHVPIQQIARVLVDGEPISDGDRALIEQVIDTTWIREIYAPTNADNIKELVRAGHQEVLVANKGAYLMLWLRLGLTHPGAYLRAYIDLTESMWFPDTGIEGIADIDGVYPNGIGMVMSPLIGGHFVVKAKEILLKLGPRIPLYGMLWSMGFFFWVLIFAAASLLSERKKEAHLRLLLLLPSAALYLTLLMATPCGSTFRYVYPMVFVTPILVILTLLPFPENGA